MSKLSSEKQWFVLRDLRYRISKDLAIYKLEESGVEVFTPMTEVIVNKRNRKERYRVPIIKDLLFVYSTKSDLDVHIQSISKLQYRYQLGKTAREPMTVREKEMRRFIIAVRGSEQIKYYMPSEITPSMYGRKVRIVGGPLDNCEGHLLSVRGLRKKKLLVEIPEFIAAAVEVDPEYVQLLN